MDTFFKREDLLYKDFGVFLCCGVERVEKIKRLLDYAAAFGYVSFRWEIGFRMDVDGLPPMNFSNGKYTEEEIKEIDDYAYSKGLEVIPCVQCLKHDASIAKVKGYENVFGGDGYLDANEPSVLRLLEKYFLTCKRLFRSRKIHIGMDDVFYLGSKGYLSKYGYEEQGEIYMRQLRRVLALANDCGLQCEMWGDKLKDLARKYRSGDKSCTKNCMIDFPQDVRVIEWYYGGNYGEKELGEIFGCFEGVSEIGYCDAIYNWIEYIPHNAVGLNTYESHSKNMAKQGVTTYLVSIWNDFQSGSPFSALADLFACSVYNHGKKLDEEAKGYFKKTTGVDFDDFLALDLVNYDEDWPCVFARHLFEENLFEPSNVRDTTGLNEAFAQAERRLDVVVPQEFSLIFDSVRKFSRAMSVKAELATRTLRAYKAGAREEMRKILDDVDLFVKALDEFKTAFYKRYQDECKTKDVFVCAARLGALRENTLLCKDLLAKYLDGEIATIELADWSIQKSENQ